MIATDKPAVSVHRCQGCLSMLVDVLEADGRIVRGCFGCDGLELFDVVRQLHRRAA